MGTRSFKVNEKLAETLRSGGRFEDYIQSQSLVNGFDLEKPHSIVHDPRARCYVVSQETDTEDPPDEDDEVRRRNSTPIH